MPNDPTPAACRAALLKACRNSYFRPKRMATAHTWVHVDDAAACMAGYGELVRDLLWAELEVYIMRGDTGVSLTRDEATAIRERVMAVAPGVALPPNEPHE